MPVIRVVLSVAVLVVSLAAPLQSGKQDKTDEKKTSERKANDTKKPRVTRVEIEVKGDGRPVADANVYLKQEAGFRRESSTNSQGVARFSDVPHGRTKITVTAAGYKPYVEERELTEADARMPVELVKE